MLEGKRPRQIRRQLARELVNRRLSEVLERQARPPWRARARGAFLLVLLFGIAFSGGAWLAVKLWR